MLQQGMAAPIQRRQHRGGQLPAIHAASVQPRGGPLHLQAPAAPGHEQKRARWAVAEVAASGQDCALLAIPGFIPPACLPAWQAVGWLP